MPSEPESSSLSKLIRNLSDLEADSPSFLPHVTLWYPIPISTPVDDITSTLQSIIERVSATHTLSDWVIDLDPAQTGKQYYQSVLAPVKPDTRLLALRTAVEATWGAEQRKDYFPHLSLFYGDVSPERREEIAKIANGTKGDEGGLVQTITVGAVVVVSTRGPADQWQVVGRVKL